MRRNRKPIVEVLLAHGASVDGPVGAFLTPLQQACYEDSLNKDIVNFLLEQGADVDGTTVYVSKTPLTLVIVAFIAAKALATVPPK